MNVKILDSNNIKNIINKHAKDLIGAGGEEVIAKHSSRETFVTKSAIQSAMLSRSGNICFDKVIKPAIVLDSINSEISAPGSGDLSLDISSRIIKKLYGKIEQSWSIKEYNIAREEIFNFCINEIKNNGYLPFKKDLQKFINQEVEDQSLRSIVKTALDLSSARREISCEISNGFETSIHVDSGHKFSIKPYPGFLKGRWVKRDPIVLVIDGAIVEVSEIHHLLEKCNQENVPAVIFCRSLSPDVLNTLFVNKGRGTLDVIPFEISIEDKTLNILKDICVVSGSKLISSDMGDLISSSVRKGLNSVDSVEIGESYVKIFNSSSTNMSKAHLSLLRKKREESILEVQPYIDSRIKSMTSESVKIKIGQNQINRNKMSIETIDAFLRSARLFFRSGCIQTSLIEKALKRKLDSSNKIEKIQIQCVLDSISHQNKKIMSAGALAACLKTSFATASSFISTGVILAEDS